MLSEEAMDGRWQVCACERVYLSIDLLRPYADCPDCDGHFRYFSDTSLKKAGNWSR